VATLLYVQLTLFAEIVNLETKTSSIELLLSSGDYFCRAVKSGGFVCNDFACNNASKAVCLFFVLR